MRKVFRLNRKGNSNYCLFIVEGNKVTFRKFRFYTGPMDVEEEMSIEGGRALYKRMINKKVPFLPHDNRMVTEWVAVS